MREWEIGAVENIHGALPYIRFAPILALVGVGVSRIGKHVSTSPLRGWGCSSGQKIEDGRGIHQFTLRYTISRAGRWLMSRGKHLSLEEARKLGRLDQFAKGHPSAGIKRSFDDLLDAMVHVGKPDSQIKKLPTIHQTSSRAASDDCSDTQIPSRNYEGASGKRERASHGSTASSAPKTPRSR